ncbi:MAG: nickel-dependent lactate racemase [Victivallales bacterium]|nr:nickel-dependent lactate racemase [Victivallales bacterium]
MATKSVHLRYGTTGLDVRVPEHTDVLVAAGAPALPGPLAAVQQALAFPIGTPSLRKLVRERQPSSVVITISDITRPVPNQVFLPPLLDELNAAGVADAAIEIVVGTGMHRPSTAEEHRQLVGEGVLKRVRVVDHRAEEADTLVTISEEPPVRVCRRFAEAEFRIVTGYIEPHFMAGFSGGRKGVCPALVDLATIQRFHGYRALVDPNADNGILASNPCHEAALAVARQVGVDFLLNVAITDERKIAGVYAGDLEKAHAAGCRDVGRWTGAVCADDYDIVITNGGGAPLDQTFYQTVKGMCTALPALGPETTLLQVSHCGEGLGSAPYEELLLRYGANWEAFLEDIAAASPRTDLDQWEFQMQARVLARIGTDRLCLVTDGIPAAIQRKLALQPVLGDGDAAVRLQRFIDQFLADRPQARVAVTPEGPYVLLRQRGDNP